MAEGIPFLEVIFLKLLCGNCVVKCHELRSHNRGHIRPCIGQAAIRADGVDKDRAVCRGRRIVYTTKVPLMLARYSKSIARAK
jgi:hypothetical protein